MRPKNLSTAQELGNLLGKKYFYRQNIYRLAEDSSIPSFNIEGNLYFSAEDVKKALFLKLAKRIRNRFPNLRHKGLMVSYDEQRDKKITIYSTRLGFKLQTAPNLETEEDLLKKLEGEEVKKMADFPVDSEENGGPPPPPPSHGPHGPHHPPHHGPHHDPHHGEPPHEEILEALRRIEDRLKRIEYKLG